MSDDTVDSKGYKAIHYAAAKGYTSCIRTLLEKRRLDLSLPTAKGRRSILHLAVEHGNFETVRLILNQIPKLKNNQDFTRFKPIQLACIRGDMQIVKQLSPSYIDLISDHPGTNTATLPLQNAMTMFLMLRF